MIEKASDSPSEEGGAPSGSAARTAGPAAPLGVRLEAVLFAASQPLSPVRLSNVLQVELGDVHEALAALAAAWRDRPGAIDLVEVAGGWRFLTRPEHAEDLARLRSRPATERLSPAALETLSVVAYRQPVTRAEIEGVRGVAVGPLLRLLLERDLIRITGRSTEPGHPLLYGTTKRFLDHFGLASLKDLPDLKELLESA